jgi:putative flippase GtrA
MTPGDDEGAAPRAAPRAAPSAAPAWLRYLAVGALATAAHYALLWLAVERGAWPPPLAAGAGAALGAQVGFLGNRGFTFGHSGAWWPAWWRFQATALLGAVSSMAVVALGGALGLHYLPAQLVATGLVLVLTYAINRRWTFG